MASEPSVHGAANNGWVMRQTWSKLLFAHWPVKPEALRPLIPPALAIDTFDGMAWVGVVPFYMSGVRFRSAPPIPTTTEFCELNVRTYVMPKGGKPGVWFFSLDASSVLAVAGARMVFHLPYYKASMRLTTTNHEVYYFSHRNHLNAPIGEFEGHYQPVGDVFHSQSGTLEYWLTERYCLYAADRRQTIYQGDIVHAPWPLQPAEADIGVNTMAQASTISLPDTAPLLHYAEHLDVQAWFLRRIAVS
ncbi:MAG: DUF2071 domain-containing protein [Anaerolineaceae bacterium]|nr:DUF2071 domain-containing protein [Anaerolineaceae bacterium]